MQTILVVLMASMSAGVVEQPAGFKSYWVTDPARTYRTAFDGGKTYGLTKSPRPVLVNVWYPAVASGGVAMEHGGYLDIVPDDAKLKPLAGALVEYNRKVIAQELTGAEPGNVTAAQKEAIERAMKRSTGCVRSAAAAAGKFPLVIYHSGAGSSFEDNALLCEELARHGYVVIGSAFQAADGKTFNVDVENAGREFEFLLRVAAGMENVDINHVALVGHSAGAHGSLIYAAKAGIAIDAVVSLDTTQDYVTLSDPRWPLLVNGVTGGRENYKTPTLFVAGPSALFELADSLVHCERIYLTVPVLTHNEYISQGETAAELAVQLKPNGKAEQAQRAASVVALGKELRSIVRQYLAAKLKKDDGALQSIRKLEQAKLGAGPRVEVMPVGSAGLLTVSQVVSPRSVFHALKTSGAEGAIQLLRKVDEKHKELREHYFVFQLLYYQAATGKAEQAKALFDYYLSVGVDMRSTLVSQADFFASIQRHPTFVEGCVRLGQAIGGEDKRVLEMVKKYGERKAGP